MDLEPLDLRESFPAKHEAQVNLLAKPEPKNTPKVTVSDRKAKIETKAEYSQQQALNPTSGLGLSLGD